MKAFAFFCIFIFSISCTSRLDYSLQIQEALSEAGDNHGQLEEVLQHYGKNPADSLKLKAAQFLIANMPGKYSEYYDTPWQNIASALYRWNDIPNKEELLTKHNWGELKIEEDVKFITSEFLINNIEMAFKMWKEQPWGKNISFDIFCEEILPYRVGKEPLENWREKVLVSFADLNKYFHERSSISAVEACYKVNKQLPRFTWVGYPVPNMSYSMLMSTPRGTCDEMGALAIFVMRALGIPVVRDFTLQWPNRNIGHSWNAVRDSTGRYVSFMGAESPPGESHLGTRLAKSKVYRCTFAKQHNILDIDANIPPELRNQYIKDVSFEYKGCTFDVDLPIRFPSSDGVKKYVYLLSMGKEASGIVAWGKVNGHKMHFSDVGKRLLYLPVFYVDDIQLPATYPFRIDDSGNIHLFKPDMLNLQSVTVSDAGRSHPWLYRMQLGVFEGANTSDFYDKKPLYTIEDMPSASFQVVRITNTTPFRYVRYVSPKGGYCNVAEIEFYAKNGKKLIGRNIGTPGSWYNSPTTCDKAFDGDPTTFYDAAEGDYSWTGLDLGRSQTISDIRYLPRVEDNRIVKGCTYELFYWNGQDWKVFEKKTATGCSLHYQVPSNGLFYIRNATTDTESNKFFIVRNGRQEWL